MLWKQACVLVAAAAAAAGVAQAREVRVSTGFDGQTVAYVEESDLDLSSDRDARAMWGRIQVASHDVCGQPPLPRDMVETGDYRRCVHATEVVTVQKLGSTKVAAASHLAEVRNLYASAGQRGDGGH
jgi:UrcA family protein